MKTTPLPNGPDAWTDQKVIFCGHEAWFNADVFITPFAVAVVAKKSPVENHLKRTALELARWHITDMNGGIWYPKKGVFLLPRESVTRL